MENRLQECSQKKISFKNVRIWNGLAESIDAGIDCLTFENGQVTSVGSSDELGSDCQDYCQDMSGLTLIPGLIDAHIHLCLNPEQKDPLAQEDPGRDALLEQMSARARLMLEAGITTARDLGGGQWLELEIRDRISRGEIPGPRLICSGQPITSVKGHCHFWRGEARDVDEAIEVLDRQVEHQVDLIKVMATGGNITKGSRPIDAQFDEVTLTKIVDKAESLGLHVAAHCHGTSGIRNAARAGVTTIEHCSWVGDEGWGKSFDPEVMNTIADKGVWVSPTINSGWKRFMGNKSFEGMLQANYAKMKEGGVKLIASTDAGIPNVMHHHLPLAIPVFAHFAQLTPVQVLRAATSDCATAIGLGDVTGQIGVGYSADFLLFDGDPTVDLSVLVQPLQVYKSGSAVLEK